jgi:hypothetical protein
MSIDESGMRIKPLLESLSTIEKIMEENIVCYPSELDDWLVKCTEDGEIHFEWKLVARIIAIKINIVLRDSFEQKGFLGPITQTFQQRKTHILLLVCHRKEAPFTIQRLLEILLQPTKYYSSTHKLCNALEKLLLISLPPDRKRNTIKR